MPISIDQNFVDMFSANVLHLSQQKGSRLRAAVRNEVQKGESDFYDRIGPTKVIKKSGRNSDTPLVNMDHSRRKVTMDDYEWADLVDQQDKLRMIYSPESEYAQAAMSAFGRQMDEIVIASALGTAYSGKKGDVAVTLPSSQKLVAHDGSTVGGNDLNVRTLRRVKYKHTRKEVAKELKKYLAYTASQEMALLAQTEVTSADYNNVKALVQGEVNTFMGYEFIQTELILKGLSADVQFELESGELGSGAGSADKDDIRRCFAWAQDGILLSTGKDVTARIDERADKSYAIQVYGCMSQGGTRMEEVKVIEIYCVEAA